MKISTTRKIRFIMDFIFFLIVAYLVQIAYLPLIWGILILGLYILLSIFLKIYVEGE